MGVVQLNPEPGVSLKLHKRRCQSLLVQDVNDGTYTLIHPELGQIFMVPPFELVAVFYQVAQAIGIDPEDARALLEERFWR